MRSSKDLGYGEMFFALREWDKHQNTLYIDNLKRKWEKRRGKKEWLASELVEAYDDLRDEWLLDQEYNEADVKLDELRWES